MSNMLADGVAWLAGQLADNAARSVVYVRGNQRLELSATIGRTEFQIEDMGGVRVEYSDRDFIVPASAFTLDGEVTEPARGDKIEDPSGPNGTLETFEVMGPGNERPFRYDSTGQLLRIHTKKVKIT